MLQTWLVEHLPAALLAMGPRGLGLWQWLALLPLIAAAGLAGLLLRLVSLALLRRLAAQTASKWDDDAIEALRGPLALAWSLAFLMAVAPLLDPTGAGQALFGPLVRGLLFGTLFWCLLRLVEVTRHTLSQTEWASRNPASRSLLQLGTRTTKAVTISIAGIAVVSQLGYPVASLLAGLGIGGLAVALAAQKTVENVLGAFSLGFDQPFREGDFVKVEDFVGTVETIGLRSTRFRTLGRTLISIPNGRLAEMRLESYAARDRLRLACTIGIEYGATVAQMRTLLAGLERALREHPKIWPDNVVVRFAEFAASSLDIEVMAWFCTSDWDEFQLIRQDILLRFMDVVEAAGCSFAFPTTTVHVAGPPAQPRLPCGESS